METVKGYVEHIVFRNEDNGYTVFNLNNDDGDLTCVGNFNYLSEGELVEVNGEYVVHSVYGTQLRVLNYEIKAPEDLLSIERYLGSGAIKGVGASLAGRIVKKFREDTFRIIEEEPERLAEVRGISERMAREIAVQVEEKKDMRKAMIYLQKFGISTTLAAKIYQFYGPKTYQVLEGNPYQLMDLSMEKKIVLKESEEGLRVYVSNFYYLELNTAKMLHDLNLEYEEANVVIEKKIHQIEKEAEMQLDEKQENAVMAAVRNGIMILTGGPGTGKTTTINAMIEYFHSENMEIMLAAPTGRAAKRMTEATGWEAQTIHRLLEVNGNPEEDKNPNRNGFARNADNPLETDVIIIDEMSMVDLPLMNALLTAIVPGTRLILVGDCNQLPSVGPGSISKDLIASECFPVVMLTRIFRQAQESDIVVNAHKINRGEPVLLDNKSRDFFFLKRQDPNVIISVLLTLIQKKLPKYVNAKPYDIQVLTPMRKGLLGVERLNSILQEYLNPPEPGKAEKEYGDHKFRVGDKVMQIKNNYQLEWEITTKYGLTVDKGMGIFNGDMGIVTEINTYTETLEVEYDEKRKVKYPFELLEELELAYAITIHKSQGSEYPAVVIPLLSGPRQLFHRNLLYTAITRARKCVTIVGNDQTFQEMIRNTNEHNRNTSLAERIREFCG